MTVGDFPGAILTREVRWFFDGPCPSEILEWFHARFGDMVIEEHRVDEYHVAALNQGIGRKRRSGSDIDVKHLQTREVGVELSDGVSGTVEDWVKVELAGDDEFENALHVTVDKRIVSVQLDVPDSGGGAGCDIELADVLVEGMQAWSLCLETYGDEAMRPAALDYGVSSLGLDTLDYPLELEASVSCSYPVWLLRLRATDT